MVKRASQVGSNPTRFISLAQHTKGLTYMFLFNDTVNRIADSEHRITKNTALTILEKYIEDNAPDFFSYIYSSVQTHLQAEHEVMGSIDEIETLLKRTSDRNWDYLDEKGEIVIDSLRSLAEEYLDIASDLQHHQHLVPELFPSKYGEKQLYILSDLSKIIHLLDPEEYSKEDIDKIFEPLSAFSTESTYRYYTSSRDARDKVVNAIVEMQGMSSMDTEIATVLKPYIKYLDKLLVICVNSDAHHLAYMLSFEKYLNVIFDINKLNRDLTKILKKVEVYG